MRLEMFGGSRWRWRRASTLALALAVGPARVGFAAPVEPLTPPVLPPLPPLPSASSGDAPLPPEAASMASTSVGEGSGDKRWTVKIAQEHVRRGFRLFDEGDLTGAHAELERAYAIAPSFKILYNLGQLSLRRQDYVTAENELRAYLAEGKSGVASARRKEVEALLEEVGSRTATLEVLATPEGAKLVVDDVNEASLPLVAPVRINVGRHAVAVVWPSGDRQVKTVETAGGDRVVVHFEGSSPPTKEAPRRSRLHVVAAAPGETSDARTPMLAQERSAHEEATHGARHGLRRRTWIAWAATALAAAGAGATGVLALRSSRDLADDRMAFPADQRSLDDGASTTRRYALATDILGASAVILAGVALTFSLSD